jgi:ankyrin repeat protein
MTVPSNRGEVIQSSLCETNKKKLLDSLRFDQLDARQMTIRSAHLKTCKWLLRSSEYINWLDATKLIDHHGFLWIKGKPGTGKSTLMKFAFTNARKTMKDKVIISFFFNARGDDIERSTTGMYRSLLLQLLEQLPALQSVFDSLGLATTSIGIDYQWKVEILKTLLEQAIQNLRGFSVVCFIDALDECEEQQTRDMVQFFERVGELAVAENIVFQVCFSSRHYPYITIRQGLSLVLEGQEGHSQDIASYIKSELKIGRSRIAEEIRNELQEKALSIFMWVVLVIKILNEEHDDGRMHALQRRLKEIPSDLHKLFREILIRNSRNRPELVLCIQWVLFARQPLSPEQLYFAVLSGVEPDEVSRWNSHEITKDDIKRFILSSSKGLVEITTTKLQKVQFIHESVREFFLKQDGLRNVCPDLGSNLLGQSHEGLKQCCLNYMSMDIITILKIPEKLPKASSQQASGLRKSAVDGFPFLDYAVRNILHHADAAEGSGVSQKGFVSQFQLPCWIRLHNVFEKRQIRRHTERASLLYILAEFNMSKLISQCTDALLCLKVERERYGCPFFAAFATGSQEALQVFMEALTPRQHIDSRPNTLYTQCCRDGEIRNKFGRDFKYSRRRSLLSYMAAFGNEMIFASLLKTQPASTDLKDSHGRSPLSRAAENGSDGVAKLLLDTGAVDINSTDENALTPLSWAANNGNAAIVKLLLDTGKACINSRDREGMTPLLLAARGNHQNVVKLLLNTDQAEVNVKDLQYQDTALSHAAKLGHWETVKLLLDTGKADIDSKDYKGQTPLSKAAGHRHIHEHETVIKLLLDTGKVDVDSKDHEGRTPLSHAVERGSMATVRLLLDTDKVDVSFKDHEGRTLLSHAADRGNETIVKLLLKTGNVDVDLKDNKERTPLLHAARSGNIAVFKLLLGTGKVDVDLKDHGGRTPLSYVAAYGDEAVVKQLLDAGKVDVDSKDHNGETPLSYAAVNMKHGGAIVKLLLGIGKVEVDSKNYRGWTPLIRSVQMGCEAQFKLLLDIGKADINSKDKDGRTPLSWAAEGGKEQDVAIFKLLLDKDKVDKDSEDDNGRTPLSHSAQHGSETISKLLLSTGEVNADSRDHDGRTPLFWAAGSVSEAVVKLLLETGKVDVNSKDRQGCTPFLRAAVAGWGCVPVLQLLLGITSVDVDLKDRTGRTPLSWAAGRGVKAAVELLLGTGKVYVDSTDHSGRTPISWAAQNEHEAIVQLLRPHSNSS